MQIIPFTVGPILGHVSDDTARIFGRGDYVEDSAAPKRSIKRGEERLSISPPKRIFGAVRICRSGSQQFGEPIFCELLPHSDFTGINIVSGLTANSEYDYQAGWFCSDGTLEDPLNGESLDWNEASTYSFRTAWGSDRTVERSFVFGSCHYLHGQFLHGYFPFVTISDKGDEIFGSIKKQIDDGRRTDLLLMIGDQIYSDSLNNLDEYLERYQIAFSQPHLADLIAQVPTYMMIDDHEIQNDWPKDVTNYESNPKYLAAIQSYQIYQASHSPLGILNKAGTGLGELPWHLWYCFSNGCCDFFVADTRTERDLEKKEIMSRRQMGALKAWLADGSGQVKVIVSPVPLVPDLKSPEDKWGGFLCQRDELLNFIYDRNISKVLVISGDVHHALSAELVSKDNSTFQVVSVISSPFYFPLPIPGGFEYGDLDSHSSHSFQVTPGIEAVKTNNFARLTVNLDEVTVEIYSPEGDLRASRVHTFV